MCCGNENLGKASHGKKETRQCDCCFIVDGDPSPKSVEYCHFCNAWLCTSCDVDLIKRGKALEAVAIQKVKKGIAFIKEKLTLGDYY